MDDLIDVGSCTVCGAVGKYLVVDDVPTRENYQCSSCAASLRYRHQAYVLVKCFGRGAHTLAELANEQQFRQLVVYEPGIIGPFRRYLRRLEDYRNSYFWPDIGLGQTHDGARCEDLQRLTFPSASIDLIISSDILEHVRHPEQAFAETFRVLRPGGRHIFTVPFTWPLPSLSVGRVDTSGDDDVFLLPPVYHGSPVDPAGSLVYTDFGADLPEQLRAIGYRVTVHHGYRHNVTIEAERPSQR